MKKAVLLALVLALFLSPACGVFFSVRAESAGETEQHPASLLYAYQECRTIPSLFSAAETALENGLDPGLVYEAMFSVAEERNFLREFEAMLENSAAYGSPLQERVSAVAAAEDRSFDPGLNTFRKRRWEAIGYDPCGHYSGSEAFRSMISDPGARYCQAAGLWTESDFSRVFGTDFNKFRPARPRAGCVCVVISDKSQNEPETAWNTGSAARWFLNRLETAIRDTVDRFEESDMTPIFTGNPDTASSFWVFDLHYPFQAWYGRNNVREVRGFGCDVSMNVIDAATHRSTAKVSASGRLGRYIDTWHDGIAEADAPYLSESRGFDSFAAKVEAAIGKEYASEDLSPRLTPVSAGRTMNRLLLDQADENAGAWIRAICESGAADVRLEPDAVSFRVRGFDPRLKELGAYARAADGEAWLQEALDNASGYNLELTLPVEDGRLPKKARTSLGTALKKAASSAETAFGGKDLSSALQNHFFPSPAEAKNPDADALLAPSGTFSRWYASRGIADTGVAETDAALLCYAQKSLSVSAKPGPHALEITVTGAQPQTMLKDCAKEALDTLAFSPAASRGPADSVGDALNAALARASLAAHKKSNDKYTFSADVDDLAAGKNPNGYLAFLSSFDRTDTLARLLASAEKLPDSAALTFPASKKLTGPNAGTRVSFEPAPGADPVYVQIRSADKNEPVASAFALPGKKVAVQVPAGYYRIAFCSGPYWYGEEELFSAAGRYYVSEETQILDRQYTHTFSLDPADEYELLFFEASPADFR